MFKAQLIVVQGKPEGKTIPLAGPVFRIGRDETCHLRPSSVEVSRQHAEFTISESGVTLRDLGSRNGTQLNSKTITGTVPVKSGDLIRIGQLTFALSIQGAPAAGAAARPAGPPKSLDEVDQAEVESWLIADNTQPVPDRPSGVFTGDTISINAFRTGQGAKSDPNLQSPAAAATPAPAPAPAPAAPAPPPPAPAPAPAPVAAAPSPPPAPAAPPTPPPPVTPAPAPAAVAPPAPAPAPPPVAPAPPPVPAPAPADDEAFLPAAEEPGLPSFLEGLVFEALPEGEGDAESDPIGDEAAEDDEAGTSEGGMPEEFIDESNPFYVAKKKEQEAAETPAASAKSAGGAGDSSEAAKAILNRMLERRRGGGGR